MPNWVDGVLKVRGNPDNIIRFLKDGIGDDNKLIVEDHSRDKYIVIYNDMMYLSFFSSFILFDVLINDIWLKRESVEDIATAFGIDVPIVGEGTIDEAVSFVRTNPKSVLNENAPMEGVVARPECDILDRQGKRVIVKIKVRDFE